MSSPYLSMYCLCSMSLSLSCCSIRDRPISPRSPWQNGHVERLIGTVRRECLDRMLIFGETHLRQILTLYASYYNESRTHLSLHKDTPLGRAVQRFGNIAATPILSGLHHRYARYDFRKGQVGFIENGRSRGMQRRCNAVAKSIVLSKPHSGIIIRVSAVQIRPPLPLLLKLGYRSRKRA